jgi:hypothetical protein
LEIASDSWGAVAAGMIHTAIKVSSSSFLLADGIYGYMCSYNSLLALAQYLASLIETTFNFNTELCKRIPETYKNIIYIQAGALEALTITILKDTDLYK